MSSAKCSAALVFIILLGLAVSFMAPARGQVIHENPANLTTQQPFDVDQKLMLQLEQMFGSLDAAALHVNASDFDASWLSMQDFDNYYKFFKDYLARTSITGSEYQLITGQADLTAGQLRAIIGDAEDFDQGMAQFDAYMEAGDRLNATLTAVDLQRSFNAMNGSTRQLTLNANTIERMLQNTSVNTNHLDQGIDTLNTYLERMRELNAEPLSLLGNTNLTLRASPDAAGTGDMVIFTGTLQSNDSFVGDGLVSLYVNGNLTGSARTGSDGRCTFYYQIPGGSFGDHFDAIAYFDPQGASLSPAVSNSVTIRRLPIATSLSLAVSPGVVRYGDVLHVQGSLIADGRYPVSQHPVDVHAGETAYSVITAGDGSYACDIPVTPRMSAGILTMSSEYNAATAPGEALQNATSPGAPVRVMQSVTFLTLAPLPPSLVGGQNVSFNGTLMDENGQPVGGEKVSVYAEDTPIISGVTDKAGKYDIRTTVPLSLSAGPKRVYAAYEPGDGRALAGSRSDACDVNFLAVRPSIDISGVPQVIFQGDTLELNGRMTVPGGKGVGGNKVSISVGDVSAGTAITGADGSFSFKYDINGSAGLCSITAASDAGGLLEGARVDEGSTLILPFDQPTFAVIAIIVLLVALLAVLRLTRMDRRLRGALAARRTASPAAAPQPVMPEKAEPMEAPAVTPEEDVARIVAIIKAGARGHEVISEIYLAARRMAGALGIAVPGSMTHREFLKRLMEKEPSLAASAGTITGLYEKAVFGHAPLSKEEIYSSLKGLQKIIAIIYEGDGGA